MRLATTSNGPVEAWAAEMYERSGVRVAATTTSYLRWLMDRDAEARGLADKPREAKKRARSKGETR